jgi:hypothetical protein
MATASPAMRREELVGGVGLAERDVGGADKRPVRDRLETVGDRVGAREHGDHSGQRHGGGGIDGADAGVGMRGAYHDSIGLAGKVEVVAELTLPDHQGGIFLADDRLADSIPGCAFRHRFPAATIAVIALDMTRLAESIP